jgi:DNA-binding NarL/FixJ family response regulator
MEETMPVNVIILEDEPDARDVMKLLVDSEGEFRCVGVYGDGRHALADLSRTHPDLALIDIRLPQMSGIECARHLKSLMPKVRIIMVTGSVRRADVSDARRAGAPGYITKPFKSVELVEAMRFAMAGGVAFSANIADGLGDQSSENTEDSALSPVLTQREEEVMKWLEQGLIYKEIADKLGIKIFTVKHHIEHAFMKLGAHNKAEALKQFRLLRGKN